MITVFVSIPMLTLPINITFHDNLDFIWSLFFRTVLITNVFPFSGYFSLSNFFCVARLMVVFQILWSLQIVMLSSLELLLRNTYLRWLIIFCCFFLLPALNFYSMSGSRIWGKGNWNHWKSRERKLQERSNFLSCCFGGRNLEEN